VDREVFVLDADHVSRLQFPEHGKSDIIPVPSLSLQLSRSREVSREIFPTRGL
jgi:hypothetical protein